MPWTARFMRYDSNNDLAEVEDGATFAMLHDHSGQYVADVHGLVEEPTDAELRARVALILNAINQPHRVPRFEKTFCSQCGGEFGPGDHGYSHCSNHRAAQDGSGLGLLTTSTGSET